MSQEELDANVAIVTGEDLGTIRQLGFSVLKREASVTERADTRPQVIDWDGDPGFYDTCFLDELTKS